MLIAGSIGISPIRSILQTLRDRENARPVVLFYAACDWSRVSFRGDIDALTRTLNLTVRSSRDRVVVASPAENGGGLERATPH